MSQAHLHTATRVMPLRCRPRLFASNPHINELLDMANKAWLKLLKPIFCFSAHPHLPSRKTELHRVPPNTHTHTPSATVCQHTFVHSPACLCWLTHHSYLLSSDLPSSWKPSLNPKVDQISQLCIILESHASYTLFQLLV